MAKRRVTDIARERGLDPNEVARRLFEAGVPIQRDMVDEVAAARALAGSRPTASAKNGQKRRPGAPPARPATSARAAAPAAPVQNAHPQAIVTPPPAPPAENRPPRERDPRTGIARPPARAGSAPTSRPARAARAPTAASAPTALRAPPAPAARAPAARRAATARPAARAPTARVAAVAPVAPRCRPSRPHRSAVAARSAACRRARSAASSSTPRPPGRRASASSAAGAATQRPEREERPVVRPTGPVTVHSGVTVKELAEKLSVSTAEIIKTMMGLGEFVTITQSLTDDAVGLIGEEYGREITIQHAEEEVDEPPSRTRRTRW